MGPIVLFILVLFSILFCSRYISIALSALIGAFIAIVVGYVSLQELKGIIEFVANPTITLVLIVIISLLLKNNGFFDFFALKLISFSKKNTYVLFGFIILFGAILASFFTNDGAILILTPIVLSKFKYIKLSKKAMIAFVMAAGFIADTSSLTFTISNLTNIMGAEFLSISFNSFFKSMWLINCISVAMSFVMLFLVFRKDLPESIKLIKPLEVRAVIKDKALFYLSVVLLVTLFIVFFVASVHLIPSSIILLPFTLILLIASLLKKIIRFKEVVKKTPFTIIFFSLGMYILIYAIKPTALFTGSQQLMDYFLNQGNFLFLFCNAIFVAICSCIFNNLPAFLFSLFYIDQLSLLEGLKKLAVLSSVIGANIGPKMSPIGSLATLLWLSILKRDRIVISWKYYLKVGMILTLPTLVVTILMFCLINN